MCLRRRNVTFSRVLIFLSVVCTCILATSAESSERKENSTETATQEPAPEFKLTAKNFFLTPPTDFMAARDYCHEHNGEPFVPRTMLELRFLEYKVTKTSQNGWLPLTDIREEGRIQWENGSDYEAGFVDMEMGAWSLQNTNDKNCVAIDSVGKGFWVYCFFEKQMLCIRRSKTPLRNPL